MATGIGYWRLPMPYLLRIPKRDPQVAAGPIATRRLGHADAAGLLQIWCGGCSDDSLEIAAPLVAQKKAPGRCLGPQAAGATEISG